MNSKNKFREILNVLIIYISIVIVTPILFFLLWLSQKFNLAIGTKITGWPDFLVAQHGLFLPTTIILSLPILVFVGIFLGYMIKKFTSLNNV